MISIHIRIVFRSFTESPSLLNQQAWVIPIFVKIPLNLLKPPSLGKLGYFKMGRAKKGRGAYQDRGCGAVLRSTQV